MVSPKVVFVVICGILSLFVAVMNSLESVTMTFSDYWMFIAAILIFVCAGLMHQQENK
jgi:hypothetical protein